jgi:hypothetical protein
MQDQLLLTTLFYYGLVLVVLLLIARFVFSIHTIIYNLKSIKKILSGIAIKQGVDSHYLDGKV